MKQLTRLFGIYLCFIAVSAYASSSVKEMMGDDADIMKPGYTVGVLGVELSYVVAKHPDDKVRPSLLIINGRTETWVKYRALIRHFYELGYNVYSYDHRGQGLSGRMQKDLTKGYVADFNYYVEDMRTIYGRLLENTAKGPIVALSHSMGGAVLVRYLEEYPSPFKAAVLVSPMIEPNTGFPFAQACGVARTQRWLAKSTDSQSFYLPTQGPWKPRPFKGNDLTHSEKNFDAFQKLQKDYPEIRLGGVSAGWLAAVCDMTPLLTEDADKISTPIELLQASEDTVVSKKAQDVFCKEKNAEDKPVCVGGKPLVIEGAYHEILFELPKMRDEALKAIETFYNKEMGQQ